MHYEIFEGLVDRDTICFHGNLASNIWWEPAMEEWRKTANSSRKGRLVCAEWRGCGKSTGLHREEELNLPDLADDYNGLLRELEIKNSAAIGHSTGGLIALYAMRRAPELYSRAVLLDPVGASGVKFGPEMFEAFTAMSQDKAMCQAVMTGTVHEGTPRQELMAKIVDDAFGVHPLVWHGVARMLQNVNFHPELSHITQPVLVMHGERDSVLPISDSQTLAAGLPNGKFLELKGRGHSCNVENPALFVNHVNNFLFG